MHSSHPFYIIYNHFLLKRKNSLNDYTFCFSKYIYLPDSVDDKRINFQIKGNELTEERIRYEILSLKENEELAFHSKFRIKEKFYHFPFIDFSISVQDWNLEQDFIRLKRIIPHVANELFLFDSGRSLHGYSLKLFSSKEWLDFMGRLLLVDLANSERKLVDSRWIGHRLMAGYSSLRWSNNSGMYLSEPRRIYSKHNLRE